MSLWLGSAAGLAALLVGVGGLLNWRNMTRRCSEFFDDMTPSVRWQTPGSPDAPRFLAFYHVTFGVLALIGAGVLAGCLIRLT